MKFLGGCRCGISDSARLALSSCHCGDSLAGVRAGAEVSASPRFASMIQAGALVLQLFADEAKMAKKAISSTDLIWIFHEKLKEFDDCPDSMSIAIVPMPDVGWAALMSPRQRAMHPQCARRVEVLQEQLRELYVLKGQG